MGAQVVPEPQFVVKARRGNGDQVEGKPRSEGR